MKAPQDYYAFRPEIARLIPIDARTIVDVGCGDGAFGRGLKSQRLDLCVYGIEIDPLTADRARVHLDSVLCAGADAALPVDWKRADCVVFADVLEHMIDPWRCLRLWRDRLAPGATVIVSLPNVLHCSALGSLLRGRWDYQSAGVLDRTHLRFFTRDTGVEMLRAAGFVIERFERVWRLPAGFARWPGAIARRIADRRSNGTLPRPGVHFADFYSLQYLFVAK